MTLFSLLVVAVSCGDDTLRTRVGSKPSSNALSSQNCEAVYDPVCGQPPMPTCPSGQACIQVMPAPKTYDNNCQMLADGATLVSVGTCQ